MEEVILVVLKCFEIHFNRICYVEFIYYFNNTEYTQFIVSIVA